MCVSGVPLPQYIKEPRGRGPPARRRAQEESYSYREYDSPPPILVGLGFPEGERGRRGPDPFLVLIGLGEGGGARPPWAAPFSFPLKPIKAHMAPGGFR